MIILHNFLVILCLDASKCFQLTLPRIFCSKKDKNSVILCSILYLIQHRLSVSYEVYRLPLNFNNDKNFNEYLLKWQTQNVLHFSA